MSDLPVFAARGDGGDPVIAAIGTIVIVVVAIVLIVREAFASYDLNIKGGLPYCPRCNRQVSYRRDVCRACGYAFKTYGPTAQQASAAASASVRRRLEAATRDANRLVARMARDRERRERRAARDEARDAYYRERGIEPGPWAWYEAMPEWAQAALVGLGIAVPVVVVIAAVFQSEYP